MKKIIPIKKQLEFKTNINEITSISLENTLHTNNNIIQGDLIVNGTYKITEQSTKVEEFEYKIPSDIEIDDKYIIDDVIIDIYDFYYEITSSNTLGINIEIILDNIIEKKEEKEKEEELMETKEKEERCVEQEDTIQEKAEEINDIKEPKQEDKQEIKQNKTIFDNVLEDEDDYSTYYIYIVRENDTLETIMTKYNISKEKLEEYNNLEELKIGNKIIIPETKNE